MKSLVLGFAGGIAAGKSTLSERVAKELGVSRASFGNYVRHIARLRGLNGSREELQEVGQSLIELGWERFCRSVLAEANWELGQPLVVDGIRHAEAVDTLRSIVAPSRLLLVVIQADRATREERLRGRDPKGASLTQVEAHPTEEQINTSLPAIADLILDGARPVEELVHAVVLWLQRQRGLSKYSGS